MKRVLVATIVAVLATSVALFVIWQQRPRRLDARSLERLLDEVVAGATDGLYRLRLGEIELLGEMAGIRAEEVTILPDPEAVAERRARGDLPAVRFELRVDAIEIREVGRAALIAGTALRAASIEVSEPRITAIVETGRSLPERPPAAPGEQAPPVRAELLARRVDEMLQGIPELDVETVSLTGGSGSIEWRDPSGATVRRDHVDSVDIRFEGLHIHEDAGREGFRSLYSDDVRVEAAGFRLDEDADRGWGLDTLSLSTREERLAVGGVRLDPALDVTEYLARPTVAGSARVSLWIGEAVASRFHFHQLLEALELRADEVVIDRFRMEVLEDSRKPSTGSDDPPRGPHRLAREAALRFGIDTVKLSEGFVSYSEQTDRAPRPGTISFENLAGTVSNLTNAPRDTSPDRPSRWDLTMRLYGQAPVDLLIEIPLLEPSPTMQVQGTVGAFDPEIVNGILTPLTGTAIRGGSVQGVRFGIDYTPGRARGEFTAEYENLRVSPVDPATGGRDLREIVAGFVASHFIIHDDNRSSPDTPARSATIDRPLEADRSFFSILWLPLRDGARDLVVR